MTFVNSTAKAIEELTRYASALGKAVIAITDALIDVTAKHNHQRKEQLEEIEGLSERIRRLEETIYKKGRK